MGNFATVESGIDNEIGSWKGLTSGRKQNLYWTGERVLWDMLIESKSDIRLLEGFVGKDWGWKWKGLVEQIDWQRLTHCLTLMPWPTWAFCLLFSEGLKRKKKGALFEERKITSQLCGVGVRLTERELFPRVRREGESKDGHRCDEEAGDDEVEEVVERSPPDPHHEGDVEVRFGTAVVDHFVPGGRHSCEKHIHHSLCIGFPESLHWSKCFASVCHKKMEYCCPQMTLQFPHIAMLFQNFRTIVVPAFELCILHCTESCFSEFQSRVVNKTSLKGGFRIVDCQGTPRTLQAPPDWQFQGFLTKHIQDWF